jgi:O-antigen ligase
MYLTNKNILLLSIPLSFIIVFYGNFTVRYIFSWTTSIIMILGYLLLILSTTRLDKTILRVVFINSLWILYAILTSFHVQYLDYHFNAILESLLYIFVFTIILTLVSNRANNLHKLTLNLIYIFTFTAFVVFLLRIFELYGYEKSFSALFSNRNDFAFMMLVLTTILLNTPNNIFLIFNRYFKISIIVLMIFFIMITGSSKGAIGVFIVLILYNMKNLNIKRFLLLMFSVLIMIFSILLFFENTTSRLMSKGEALSSYDSSYTKDTVNNSGEIRIFLIINAIDVFLENKYLGVGINNGQFYLQMPKKFAAQLESLDSQNNITEMLLNGGIPGFLLYYLPLLWLLREVVKIKRTKYNQVIRNTIITLITLKLFMDIGMKSYNDAGHIFLVVYVWVLYYKFLINKKERINE